MAPVSIRTCQCNSTQVSSSKTPSGSANLTRIPGCLDMGASVRLLYRVRVIASPTPNKRSLGSLIAVPSVVIVRKVAEQENAPAQPVECEALVMPSLGYRARVDILKTGPVRIVYVPNLGRVILPATHRWPSGTCTDAQSCGRARHH